MTTTLHAEHAALLAAVIEQRHDLTPRLVLADFLDEYAEAIAGGSDHCGRAEDVRARAEFVRLQIKMGYELPPVTTHRTLILSQVEGLLDRHRHAWLDDEFFRAGTRGDFYGGTTYAGDEMLFVTPETARAATKQRLRWKWRAGFLDCLTCSWELWDAIGDRVYRAWPVIRVEIRGKPPAMRLSHTHMVDDVGPVYHSCSGRPKVEIVTYPAFKTTTMEQRRAILLNHYWPGVTFTFQS